MSSAVCAAPTIQISGGTVTLASTTSGAAIRYTLAHGQPGDVIVLAGKGHETYQEVDGVKHHLDEREEIEDFFAQQ